jgi:uncharacterized protein
MSGALPDARWGTAATPLPDWRRAGLDDDADPDDELLPETPPDVIAALGFDPLDYADPEFAHDAALAFDASVRHYDQDGRLHVALNNISKANICQYRGGEIPKWEELGLDPDRLYRLYRDPEELAKAAGTFNNLPILKRHVPVTAQAPRPDLVIGSTGTDAQYAHPYLRNSLVVWDQDAIDRIENAESKQLSAAYHYRADMTPGAVDGERHDGVMRDIRGNHVAAVPEGRAGDDVVVGDAKPPQETSNMPTAAKPKPRSARQVLFLTGAMRAYALPRLAQDAKMPDLRPILKDVTAKTWPKQKAAVGDAFAAVLRDRLAEDASIDDVHDFLDSLDKSAPGGEEGGAPPPEDLDDAGAAPPPDDKLPVKDAEGEPFEGKETPAEEILEYLQTVLSPEQLAHVRQIAQAAAGNGGGNGGGAPAAPPGKDAEPGGVNPNDQGGEKNNMDKLNPAMDAAIAKVRKDTEESVIKRMQDIRTAEEAVRPYIGALPMALDSADAVYKTALDALGVKTDGVHASAWPTILAMHPKPADKRNEMPAHLVAMDAKSSKAFAERYPDADRLKHA